MRSVPGAGALPCALLLAGCFDIGAPYGASGPDGSAVEAGATDAACGGADADADAARTDASGCPEVAVTIQYMAFTPGDVVVPAGCPVVWTNLDGSFIHTVSSGTPEMPTGLFESGPLQNGQSFTHTFATPGVYVYFCGTHPTTMRDATVTVE